MFICFQAKGACVQAKGACVQAVLPFTPHWPEPEVPASAQLMLEAANWAPTHGKTEPWRFVVLDRAAALDLVDKSIEVRHCARARCELAKQGLLSYVRNATQISKTKLSPEEFETKRAKKVRAD